MPKKPAKSSTGSMPVGPIVRAKIEANLAKKRKKANPLTVEVPSLKMGATAKGTMYESLYVCAGDGEEYAGTRLLLVRQECTPEMASAIAARSNAFPDLVNLITIMAYDIRMAVMKDVTKQWRPRSLTSYNEMLKRLGRK